MVTVVINDKTTIWLAVHPLSTNNQFTTILALSFRPNKTRGNQYTTIKDKK